jgi:hypothetical protein
MRRNHQSVLGFLFFALTAPLSDAQTAQSATHAAEQPFGETRSVASGMEVTASYGLDRQLCEAVIHPVGQTDVGNPSLLLNDKTASNLLEKIAPEKTRGKLVSTL